MTSSTTAYLGLGSNQGDREAAIRSATRALDRSAGVAVRAISALRETAPVGVTGQQRRARRDGCTFTRCHYDLCYRGPDLSAAACNLNRGLE